jgi:hypothetical protein
MEELSAIEADVDAMRKTMNKVRPGSPAAALYAVFCAHCAAA